MIYNIIIKFYYIFLHYRFYEKLNFPHTIGAIDCSHVAIIAPSENDGTPPINYLNRKGYHSINFQAVSVLTMKILTSIFLKLLNLDL